MKVEYTYKNRTNRKIKMNNYDEIKLFEHVFLC